MKINNEKFELAMSNAVIRRYKTFVQNHLNEFGTVPDDKTIMKELELTPKKLEYVRKVIHEQHCISFCAKVSDSDELTLEETLADDYDMESDIEDKLSQEHQREVLKNAIEQLKENEQMVIESRYWKNMTQKRIAEDIRVSSARIGTIEKNALRKLKKNKKLQEIIDEKYGYDSSKVYHMSIRTCIDHHTSATEYVAIKRIMMEENQMGIQFDLNCV